MFSPDHNQESTSLANRHALRSRIFSWIVFALPVVTLVLHFGIGLIEAVVLVSAIWFSKPLWIQRRELFGAANWILIAFAFSLAAAIFSLAWSGFNPRYIDNASRQLIAMAAIGLIVLARPKAEWFWHGLIAGSVAACALALYQRFGIGVARANGMHQEIMFGDVAMAMALMSLASIPYFSKTRLPFLPLAGFIAGVGASFLSGSRGGWLALILVAIPLYVFGRLATRKKIAVAALAGVLLVMGAFALPETRLGVRVASIPKDIKRFTQGDIGTSPGERLAMWKGAWKMFAQSPLVGVGRANFNPALNDLIARKEVDKSLASYQHAHSEIFHSLATEGLLGVLALMLVYLAPLAFFGRMFHSGGDSAHYALAGIMLVLSYMMFGLTQVLSSHHLGTGFYALTVSFLAGICCMDYRKQPAAEPKV